MTLFAVPNDPSPKNAKSQPDFSKIDCNWEINRLLEDETEKRILWSVLLLSVLAETYKSSTDAIPLSIFRDRTRDHFDPVSISDAEILAALIRFERRKILALEVEGHQTYVITPLVETWEFLECAQ